MRRVAALAGAVLLLLCFVPAALPATNPDGTVSVIVQTNGDADAAMQAAAGLGARIVRRWEIIDGFAAQMRAGTVLQLTGRPDVKRIAADSRLQATGRTGGGTGGVDASNLVSVYPVALRAVNAWSAGLTGNGIGVAIVDSGIQHSQGSGQQDLGSRVVADVSFNSAATNQSDKYGHGTHVAGIVGGNGTAGGGQYIGIAPKANLFNVKFSSDDGAGAESDLISALDWVYQNRSKGIRVVNLSVTSGTAESYETSALDAAVEKLWNSGVVVIVSAGNMGNDAGAVTYPPANDPYVITVGALDDQGTTTLSDDTVADWSSRGRTQDSFAKPEVLAPGAHIVSVRACDACLLMQEGVANAVDDGYFRMGGTSMAAPMVSGTVALMLEKNPKLTPNQVKWILMNTGRSYSGISSGDPKAVDAAAATAFSGTPGTANVGLTSSGGGSGSGGTASNVYWLMSLDY